MVLAEPKFGTWKFQMECCKWTLLRRFLLLLLLRAWLGSYARAERALRDHLILLLLAAGDDGVREKQICLQTFNKGEPKLHDTHTHRVYPKSGPCPPRPGGPSFENSAGRKTKTPAESEPCVMHRMLLSGTGVGDEEKERMRNLVCVKILILLQSAPVLAFLCDAL